MEKGLIRIIPDREKAKSIIKMVETTSELIKAIDLEKFPSHVTKEYYDIIRELITAILLLDGYKTQGEGAHRKLIEYLSKNYKQFTGYELNLIEELRVMRNKIAYDGFFVTPDYIKRKKKSIEATILKLRNSVSKKLQEP